jgi:hypothetical protein
MKKKHLAFIESRQGMSWSSREEEWFYSNKRLIFATKSSQTASEWVQKLNDAIGSTRPFSS